MSDKPINTAAVLLRDERTTLRAENADLRRQVAELTRERDAARKMQHRVTRQMRGAAEEVIAEGSVDEMREVYERERRAAEKADDARHVTLEEPSYRAIGMCCYGWWCEECGTELTWEGSKGSCQKKGCPLSTRKPRKTKPDTVDL
jgi:hypothetical protein